ncbi:MAG: hypothetical protein R6V10_16410 [bacterium]
MKGKAITGSLLLCLAIPLLVWAWSESTKWKLASRRDSFSSYCDYLKKHPEGAHAEEARQKAAECAAEEMESSARSCGNLFPRMAWFAMAGTDRPAVSLSILDFSLSRAAACEYSFLLDLAGMRKAVDGLLEVREMVKDKHKSRFPVRAMLDLDSILLDLEQAIVNELNSKIFMCKNQSAWKDTSEEEFQECASDHLEEKERLVEKAAAQISYDLEHIADMKKDYRKDFWKRYHRMSDNKAFAEFAIHANAIHLLERAVNEEDSTLISMRIDRVISRVNKYQSKLDTGPAAGAKGEKDGK